MIMKNVFNQNNGNINLKAISFLIINFSLAMGIVLHLNTNYFTERYDWKSDSIRLKEGAKATTTGLELN